MSIVTSLFCSVGDIWVVKGSRCKTGVVATGLTSPAKLMDYPLNIIINETLL